MSNETYVSVDIETDGPIPGEYSMLSLGAAAFIPDKTLVSTFTTNFTPLPGASRDASTMKWWESQPTAWSATQVNQVTPEVGMRDFVDWAKTIGGSRKLVFVAYPAGFDFTFVYWYMMKFVGESPFSFSALDIKSFAMPLLGTEFRSVSKSKLLKKFGKSSKRHNHVALDDAIEQGELFMRILYQLELDRDADS